MPSLDYHIYLNEHREIKFVIGVLYQGELEMLSVNHNILDLFLDKDLIFLTCQVYVEQADNSKTHSFRLFYELMSLSYLFLYLCTNSTKSPFFFNFMTTWIQPKCFISSSRDVRYIRVTISFRSFPISSNFI